MDDQPLLDALRQLGLSKYAAQTLIGLQGLESATASDISTITEVPRSQVYGATDELETLGLVNVLDATPKEFAAVRPAVVGDILQAQLERRTETAVGQLQALVADAAAQQSVPETEHVWRTRGRAGISQRVRQLISDAETHVSYYFSSTEYLPPELRTRLTQTDSAFQVQLYAPAAPAPGDRSLEPTEATAAVTVVDLPVSVTNRCTRILVVDHQAVLVGVPTHSGRAAETCFWSTTDRITTLFAAALRSFLSTASSAQPQDT